MFCGSSGGGISSGFGKSGTGVARGLGLDGRVWAEAIAKLIITMSMRNRREIGVDMQFS
jgi:hypothetical protein